MGRCLAGSAEGVHQPLQRFNIAISARALKILNLCRDGNTWAGIAQQQQPALGAHQVVITRKSLGNDQPIGSLVFFHKLGWGGIAINGGGNHQGNHQANCQAKNQPSQQVQVGAFLIFHSCILLSSSAREWHQYH